MLPKPPAILLKHKGDLSTDYTEFWQQDKLATIIPNSLRFSAYPEGWDVVAFLRRTVAPLATGRVIEIGAGYGRLCRAFPPEQYLGLDVNAEAVARAQRENPGYEFQTVNFVDEYEPADLYLAYTVFLHIDDTAIVDVINRVCRASRWLVVAEILGHRVAQQGTTPAFTRERSEYARLTADQGFALEEEIRRPYHYYPGAELSCLVFRRKDAPHSILRAFPGDLADPHLEFQVVL